MHGAGMTDNGGYLPNGRDCMDLSLVARQARWNSERWFPELHKRSERDLRSHYVLGLIGETGEVANLFKKAFRLDGVKGPHREQLADELADVFTYLVLLADECGIDLLEAFEAKQAVCEQRWGNGR